MDENDIRGAVFAIVGAWKRHGELEDLSGQSGHAPAPEALKEQQEIMEHAGLELATQFLIDLHRIADSLEKIAVAQREVADQI